MKTKFLIIKIFAVILFLFCTVSANASSSSSCGENLTWSIDDEYTLTISGAGAMNNWSSNTEAPWYSSYKSIKKIVIENGVTSIGDYSFSYFSNLTSITIPDSVTYIGNFSFRSFALASVTIPKNVTYIGECAFDHSSKLTSVTISGNNAVIGRNAFSWCRNLTAVNIGNGVTSIGDSAFDRCTSLTNITIPNSVVSIGRHAFMGCSGLTNLTIPDSAKTIGVGAFFQCSSLKSVTIGSGTTNIGHQAFAMCDSLTSITVDANNPNFSSLNGNLYNKQKTSIIAYTPGKPESNFIIPNSVTSIGYAAFQYCTNLTSVAIPDSVTSIGNRAFQGCSNIKNISIPDNVVLIDEFAFYGCSNITDITIPNRVTSIKRAVFSNCTNLISITIPKSVKSIEENAFSNCNNLKTVYYSGSSAEWNKIAISYDTNTCLTSANRIYNNVSLPINFTDDALKEIAINYPAYLEDEVINRYTGKIEETCYEAIDEYSDLNIVGLATLEGFFNGTAIVSGKILSFFTKESLGDKWLKETTIAFLQEISSSETVIKETWDKINKKYEQIEFVYGINDSVSKANLAASIVKKCPNITESQAIDLVTQSIDICEGINVEKAFDTTGKVFDAVDIVVFTLQLYDADMQLIDNLLSIAPTNSTLYRGLTLVKNDREKNAFAYMTDTYLKKEIASKLSKLTLKFGKYATSKLYDVNISITLEVTQLVMDIFYNQVYTGVKISDINQAIIAKEFHLILSSAVTKRHKAIIDAYNNHTTLPQSVLDEYKLFWDYRAASLVFYANSCSKISKNEARQSILENYSTYIKSLTGYDNYISRRFTDVKNAITAGTLQCKHYRNYESKTTNPTCTSKGYVYSYCLTCEREYVSSTLPLLPHSYTSYVVTPICNRQGYTRYTCQNCSTYYDTNYTQNPDNHRYRNATCTTPKTCLYCKETVGTALGHTYSNNCDTTCNTCGVAREVPAHTYTATVIRPTTTSMGHTAYRCNECGYTYTGDYTDRITKPTIFINNLSNGTITSFDVQLISPNALMGKIMIATYNGNNLYTLSSYNAVSNKNITVNSNSIDSIKVLWLNNFLNIKPIANNITINLTK